MPHATSDDGLNAHAGAETDAGPPRAGKAGARDTERRCIVTLERRPSRGMIRFVLNPEGQVTPDLAARLPGRGAWVSADREAVGLAARKGAFNRAFATQARCSPDLAAETETLLAKRILDQLGLLKRAGNIISGFEQVREAVRAARPACMIEASEGSEDQRHKVLALLRALYGPDRGPDPDPAAHAQLPPVLACFSGDELGMALGRELVIHACVKSGPGAQAWMGDLERLSGFRRVWLPGWLPSSRSAREASDKTTVDALAHVPGGNPPGQGS